MYRGMYPRHEKQTKNTTETTGNRYEIEILMSRMQKLKGLVAASLILKTLNDNPYLFHPRRQSSRLPSQISWH